MIADALPWRKLGYLSLVLCLFCAFGLGATVFRPSITWMRSNATEETQAYVDDLNDRGKALKASGAVLTGDPVINEYGLAAPPGKAYSITWQGTKDPGESPYFRAFAYGGGQGATNTVTFTSGGQSEAVALPHNSQNQLARPRSLPTGDRQWSVTFSSALDPRARSPQLTLDRFEVGRKMYPKGELQRGLWAWLPLSAIPLLTLLALKLIGPVLAPSRRIAVATIGCSAVASVAIAAMIPGASDALAWLVVGIAVVEGGAGLWLSRELAPASVPAPATTRPSMARLAFLSLLALSMASIGLWLRFGWFDLLREVPMSFDSVSYRDFAMHIKGPYDTGPREPVFIWLAKAWCGLLTSWNPLNMATLSLFLSVVATGTIFLLAFELGGAFCATLAAFLYAINIGACFLATQGLREELLPALCATFTWAGIRALRHRITGRLIAVMAATGALAMMTRLNSLSFIAPLMIAMAWKGRWGWKPPAIVIGATVLFAAPFLIVSKVRHGDAFYATSVHIRAYANEEFVGKPGFITKEEFDKDMFQGPPLSAMDYMFKLHPPSEFIPTMARGTWSLLVGNHARNKVLRFGVTPKVDGFGALEVIDHANATPFDLVVYAFYVLGLIACFRATGGWVLVVVIALFQLPLAFLTGRGLIDYRHAIVPLPMMLACAVVAARWVMDGGIFLARQLEEQGARTARPTQPRR